MGKINGLAKRGNIYRYRTRIPKDLLSAFNDRVEFSESLKTSDYSEAAALAKICAGKWAAAFAEKRRELSNTNDLPLPPQKGTRLLTENDARRLAQRYWSRMYEAIENQIPQSEELSAEDIEFVDTELSLDELTFEKLNHNDTLLRTGNAADSLMEEHGLSYSKDSIEIYRSFRDLLRRALLDITRRKRKHLNNDFSENGFDDTFQNFSDSSNHLTMLEAKDEFWSDVISSQNLQIKTENKRKAFLDILLEHFGSTTFVHEISREECRAFRDLIEKLPPRFSLHHKNIPLNEIAKQKNVSNMTYSTKESYVSFMVRFFNWLKQEQYISSNPAEGLKPRGEKSSNENTRDPFSQEQLNAIFNAPLYTGCLNDERGFSKKGNNIIRRGRFWLPLIALYSGLRMGEILQLSPSDISKSKAGTPYFNVHKDMALKTSNAVRAVPIHPELEHIGFNEFVDGQRTKNERLLFPEVQAASDGYVSSLFSKRFITFLNSTKIKTGTTSFHSFRHNFRDALREAGISEERAEELCGWSRGNKVSRSYGKGHSADALYDDICKIRYEGLNLKHLNQNSSINY